MAKRLTREERKTILRLNSQGWTQLAIAEKTGRNIKTVRRIINSDGENVSRRSPSRTRQEIISEKAQTAFNFPESVPPERPLSASVSLEILRMSKESANKDPMSAGEMIIPIIELFEERFYRAREARIKQTMKCMAIQAKAVYASAIRVSGQPESSLIKLAKLLKESRECLWCQADLNRRLAYVYLSLGDVEKAENSARSALSTYNTIVGPGHDLDRIPVARTLAALATVLLHDKRYEDALTAATDATIQSQPDKHNAHYLQCMFLVAYSCLHLNRISEARESVRELTRLQSQDEISVAMAKTNWLFGIIAFLDDNPTEGDFHFEQAVEDFRNLKLDKEVIACAMDHARLSGKTPAEIKKSILLIAEYNEQRDRREIPFWISKPLKRAIQILHGMSLRRRNVHRYPAPTVIIRQAVLEVRDFARVEELMPAFC